MEIMKKPKLLYGVLDWGLGHATRSLSIIRMFEKAGWDVELAASGPAEELLKIHFPYLSIYTLPSYGIHYKYKPFWWGMVLQIPRIYRAIRAEKSFVEVLNGKNNYTLIVSDNRLGFRHPMVRSIYISHQLQLSLGVFSRLATSAHAFFYRKFQSIWIPDSADRALSGKLSLPPARLSSKCRFMGILSQFEQPLPPSKNGEVLFLLSGPEPARTELEAILVKQAARLPQFRFHLVRGITDPYPLSLSSHIRVSTRLSGESLKEALSQSSCIVARSGYSTLMDLAVVRRPLIAIPTPGQGEQEYLAAFHDKGGNVLRAHQRDIDLSTLLKNLPLKKFLPSVKPMGQDDLARLLERK